jgi:DNA ligase (NAD+)
MELLGEAAKAYYDEDREIMSNLEYDRLYDELERLEKSSGIVLSGSPTQRVGYSVSESLEKQEHDSPMLSLAKTKDPEELKSWLGGNDGLLSYKLDGLTVALTYEDGKLLSAVTRGNGVVGEIITSNARAFENLPLEIPFMGKLLLRGEAIIRYSDFEKINEEIGDGGAKYKNPRNLASGSVRQLDSGITAQRHVRFYAFALVAAEGVGSAPSLQNGEALIFWEGTDPTPSAGEHSTDSRWAQMEFLEGLGFEVVRSELVTAETVETAVSEFTDEAHAEAFDLPVDGLVLGYDSISYGKSLGSTAKFPRDSIAFKWADEQEETTLIGIEWSASRTGLINPIAIFEPVEIEGSTVSRASVHNINIMEDLALGTGDKIKVYKANMIIPQISENLTRSGTEKPPTTCPVCGAPTEISDTSDVKTLRCTNEDCPARHLKSFALFVSRQALNIEGLSEQSLEKFIAAGLLHELADIFRLKNHRDTIVNMEGFGEKSFENLVAAIETASIVTRERLLYSFGIPEIGVATAKQVVRHFGYDWEKITDATEEELLEVNSVGGKIAGTYVEWFADERNRKTVDSVLSEIQLADEKARSADTIESSNIAGKTFVITGSLENYENREVLVAVIEGLGGKTAGSVSKNTDYLINNDSASASSKNKKAKALGVPIITEAEFEGLR